MRWLGYLTLLCLLLATGCTDDLVPRTQVLVQIDGNPGVRARASGLRVSLASRPLGSLEDFEEASVESFTIDKSFSWPASLALLPKGGDAQRSFRVFVEALDGSRTFVSARVISSFLSEQTLLLEIVLEDGCVNFLECNGETTCLAAGGAPRCASAKVDPQQLKSIKAPPRKDASTPPDSSEPDAGEVDAGEVDAGEVDASEVDASEVDAGEVDARVCSVEDCFNGSDDDCDSLTDCEDPECNAGATCTPDAAELLVKVAAGTACPPGYTRQPTVLHKDLTNPSCTGCACGAAGPTGCSTLVTGYENSGCNLAAAPTKSALLSSFSCVAGQPELFWGSFDMLGVGPMTVTPGSCPASGTATVASISWTSDVQLCYLERKGAGCGPGDVCVPRPTQTMCSATSEPSCPTGQTREVWYAGFTDNRSCGACTCAAAGASCANVSVSFGRDYTCGTDLIAPGAPRCMNPSYYTPFAFLSGTPTRATCTPAAPLMGAATPTGSTNLCCR